MYCYSVLLAAGALPLLNVMRTVTAQDQLVQHLIRGLLVGDRVDIVYEEALAIAVQPM